MKKMILFLVVSCCLFSCRNKQTDVTTDSFQNLQSNFENPPAEFRPVPFFVWNGKITKSEIDSFLIDYKNKGFGGVFVHPRMGLVTEYLSDDWLQLFKYTTEKCKQLGLKCWIYDENSYPSGFAGGHVPAQMPESYNEGVGLMPLKQNKLYVDTLEKYKVILKKEGEKYVNITGNFNDFVNKDGDYILYQIQKAEFNGWNGGFCYVDLLKKGVTEKFIEVTFTKGYEKLSKEDFGKSVPGTFTDEPNIHAGMQNGATRWTGDLFSEFKKRWNYDLESNLPSLFEDKGNYRKVRHDYYATLLQLFIDRWAKPMKNYCEKSNLIFTGHYWEHGAPSPLENPDNMAFYPYHQMPGIDMLGLAFNEDSLRSQFGNIRAVKELASAANQFGLKRKLSETYGGGSWNFTFNDFKRLGDWEYVLGVNFMNQHLSLYSMAGARKTDYPPSFSYHAPWFCQYKPLNDYFGRLSLALSSGEQINKTLVIEPTSTTWMYYHYIKPVGWQDVLPPKLKQLGFEFQNFVNKIEKMQVEYDLGSEQTIREAGSVNGNEFIIGKRNYSLVVLPPATENIDKSTLELLKKYLQNGGKMMVCSKNIQYVDGLKSNEITELFNQYNKQIERADISDEPKLRQKLTDESFQLTFDRPDTNRVYHQRRQLTDGQLLFITNSNFKTTVEVNVMIVGKSLVELDLKTGKLYKYQAAANNGKLNAKIKLHAAGSILLFASNSETQLPVKINFEAGNRVEKTSTTKITRLQPNVLPLDYVDLTSQNQTFNDSYVMTAADILFDQNGFRQGDPWFAAVQYKQEFVEKDKFDASTSFEVKYSFVAENIKTANTELVVENPQLWQVSINGNQVERESGKWFIDRSFGVYSISNFLKQGKNTVQLKAPKMSVFAEIAPVYICGDFSVLPIEKGFKIAPSIPIKSGVLKDFGLPFYGHQISYKKTFIVEKGKTYLVKLNKWIGALAEIRVNGIHKGIIYAEPNSLLLENLSQGQSEIEVILYTNPRNLYGPYHNPMWYWSGPWDYKVYGLKQPAGQDYNCPKAGLIEDFSLFEAVK